MRRYLLLIPVLVLAGCTGNVGELEVGSCFDDPGSGPILNVSFVDCAEPHHHEIYAEVTTGITDADFPGEEPLVTEAQTVCIERFSDFVGSDFGTSTLDISYYYPTAESWDEGDRRILCSVSLLSGAKLTGTAAGSAL